MRLEMFAIWDDKAKAFMSPFFMMNKALALRSFANAANKADSQIGVNPEDYTLFHIGTFEDSDASVTMNPQGPESLSGGLQVRS